MAQSTKFHKVALITGAARRVGAVIAQYLHQHDINVVIHYRHAQDEANELVKRLNQQRKNSAVALQLDFQQVAKLPALIEQTVETWGRLDILVNNASGFYPTPLGTVTLSQWDELSASNTKAPYFLTQAAVPLLREFKGVVVNITDIHAERPLKNYSCYCIAKAGLVMMTRCLARELAPEIRVNAIASGPVLWPEGPSTLSAHQKAHILKKTPLRRLGKPINIAQTTLFCIQNDYMTGQIIAVEGGRLLN